MFPISIYTGGAVETAAIGATYNKPPSASYPAHDDITFDELKRTIYKLTGIDEDKYGITVNVRWNAGMGVSFCFTLLPILENSMWRMVVEKALLGAGIVELFVEPVLTLGPTQNDPREMELGTPEKNGEEEDDEGEEEELGEAGDESQELTDEESTDDETRDELDLFVGRLFASSDELKRAVLEYHLRNNRAFVVEQTGNTRYSAKCGAAPKCGWKLCASGDKNGNYFQIKKIKTRHSCPKGKVGEDHRNMTAEFISQLILDLIKKKNDTSPKEIQEFVRKQYPCTPTYPKAWRAKELALAHLLGDWKESYTKLAPYFNAIQVANPGTKVEWLSDSTDDPNVRLFRGVAWAFASAIQGFAHCRPVIGVDSTPLCGKYGGTMLVAVAYDGEGQVLPLAFAVWKVEDDESWSWFMRWLREEVVGPRPLCVISDRRDSILRLFDQTDSGWCTGTGQAFDRYCSRYLCESFCSAATASKRVHLVKLLKWVLRQNQPNKFHLGMSRIMETDRKAYSWLVRVGMKPNDESALQILETSPEPSYNWLVKVGGLKPNEESAYHLWSLCEDGGRRYGIMAINGNKSVFEIFPQIQELPIAALVELTFAKSAEIFTSKREAISKIDIEKQPWLNKVAATLEERRVKASQHQIAGFQSQSGQHGEVGIEVDVEVETKTKVKHTVRLGQDKSSCTCQKPQLSGIPCSHLIAVCAFHSFPDDHFVDAAYSTRLLVATWAPQLHPPGSPDKWPDYAGVAYEPDRSSIKHGRRKHVKSHSGLGPTQKRPTKKLVRSQSATPGTRKLLGSQSATPGTRKRGRKPKGTPENTGLALTAVADV